MNRTTAILAAALAVAACGQNKTAAPAAAPTEIPATRITITEVPLQTVAHTEVYSSTVQAFAVNNIAPQSGNRIQKINVDVGSFVSKGQILAEMDKVQLTQQKLQLTNARTEANAAKTDALEKEEEASKATNESIESDYWITEELSEEK